MVLLRERTRRLPDFLDPCLPRPAKRPPAGPGWLHEIKHDGFRILGRRDGRGARLITRNGNDFSARFPFIAMAVAALPARSCLIDGEAIVTDASGLAVFDLIRGHGASAAAVLCAFDLLELDGEDLRPEPIEERKEALARLLRRAHASVVVNEHYEADGAIVYRHACALGCEGIVSKRRGSPYRGGRSEHWIKVKNPGVAGRVARSRRGVALIGFPGNPRANSVVYYVGKSRRAAMPTSEHYKHSADECRRLAEQARDEIERGTLLQMANQWDKLAVHKAKIEKRQPGE